MKKTDLTVSKQNNVDTIKYVLGAADVYDDRAADKASQLNNIIPLQYQDQDGKRTISAYAHEDTTLEAFMKGTLAKREVLCVLKGLISAFEIGTQGIPVSYVIKDAGYIYINRGTLGVKVVLIPIKQDVMPLAEIPAFFREIISSMRFDEIDQDNYVAQLLTMVNSDDFSVGKLSALVDEKLEQMGLFVSKDNGLVNMSAGGNQGPVRDVKVSKLGVMNNMRAQGMPQPGMMPQGMPQGQPRPMGVNGQPPQPGMMPQGMPPQGQPRPMGANGQPPQPGMMPQGMPPQGQPRPMGANGQPPQPGMMPQGMPPQGQPRPMGANGQPPQPGMMPQGMPPQGQPRPMGANGQPPQPGMMSQGMPPQGQPRPMGANGQPPQPGMMPQGMPPQGQPRPMEANGQPPQPGMMPQGMPPQGQPRPMGANGQPPQSGMMPQGMPPQGQPRPMGANGQPPQPGMMPQGMPPQGMPQGQPRPMGANGQPPQPAPIAGQPSQPVKLEEPKADVPQPVVPSSMAEQSSQQTTQSAPVVEEPKPQPAQQPPEEQKPQPAQQPPEEPKPQPAQQPPEEPKPQPAQQPQEEQKPQPTQQPPEEPKPQPAPMMGAIMPNSAKQHEEKGGNQSVVVLGGLVGQLGTKPVPHLVRKKTGEEINITKQEFKIGKSKTKADYAIENNSAISRVHCIIVQRDGVNYIRDNNSTNHTYIDGVELQPGKEMLLKNKMTIQLGDEEFTFLLRKGE